jgi:hypothetical protein
MTMVKKVIRSADGTVINIGPWQHYVDGVPNPMPAGAYEDAAEVITDDDGGCHERLSWLPKEATRRLKGTDYVIPKAGETDRVINPEWKAWRQSLREIVGGLNMDIPPEPPRYGVVEDEPVEEEVPAEPPVEPEDRPPTDLAELMRENSAFSDADALLALYNELTNKIMLGLASDADRALQSRLHNGLEWIKRNAVEVI